MKRPKKQGLKQLGEFGLISRFRSLLKYRSPQTVLGLGDDCAAYRPEPGRLQVLSTDCLVEGIHFNLKTHSPEILGQKALAVNLSDIAAMGATPKLALISLAIPNDMSVDFLDELICLFNREVMTQPILTMDRYLPVEEANQFMQKNNIRHLAITEEDKIVGLLSVSNLVAFYSKSFRMQE